ncbi:PTB domain-containing engulfment adapter protein 1 isoform 2 [Theobroma cacao]|uniref:PTB domain-containing engulfment adapter protein 1 isoform 2 n=1 Tax=Theobroma cacao TaxID=3641 RepID=A0A061DTR2_THECC|nr:PTB domain-containing engulfment adapter protein 1 isoform 2 [Theobroma cacao]
MSSLSFTKSTLTRGKDEVYVAAVPLRAAKGVAQLFMSTAYSLNFWDLQHFMVIVKPSSSPLPSQAFVFDFQPEDPENIYTALAALSGRAVPDLKVQQPSKVCQSYHILFILLACLVQGDLKIRNLPLVSEECFVQH